VLKLSGFFFSSPPPLALIVLLVRELEAKTIMVKEDGEVFSEAKAG